MTDFLTKQGLNKTQIAELLATSETLFVKKRTILLQEKALCSHIYFVKSGILRAGIHDEASKDWTQFFYSPEGLRWAGLSANTLLQKPSDYFIEVLEDAQIIAFEVRFFRQLRQSHIEWAKFFQYQLITIFNYLERKSINHFKYSPEKRYLSFVKAHPQIVQSVPQHYIASYIGVVPESLSRIRRRLNEQAHFNSAPLSLNQGKCKI